MLDVFRAEFTQALPAVWVTAWVAGLGTRLEVNISRCIDYHFAPSICEIRTDFTRPCDVKPSKDGDNYLSLKKKKADWTKWNVISLFINKLFDKTKNKSLRILSNVSESTK